MDKRTTDRQREKYAVRRTLKRVLRAFCLLLLALAMIGTRLCGQAGAEEVPASEKARETTASVPGADKAQDAVTWAHTGEESEKLFTPDMVPPYSGNAYADINGDIPFFAQEEMTSEAFHEYWPLDELGRCTGAYACVGPETLPTQKRGDISSVKPTGWNTNRYSDIDGEILFNRCHLIGYMLTGQDANERNLITGSRYMNVEGMLPFEESVVMYVEGTGHHVLYRVRPIFEGDNLVCDGVLMEARSVEDPLVQFCAFCYNVQPGFVIDYATGDNWRAQDSQSEAVQKIVAEPNADGGTVSRKAGAGDAQESAAAESADPSQEDQQCTYILNTNTHKFHMPYCDSVKDMKEKNKQETDLDREKLIEQGYSPCKRCNP